MAGSIWDWSQTAATNDDVDGDINWLEGQPARTVNNSARVMMQRVAQVLADISAQTSSAGSANAYTLTTASPFTAYVNGLVVGFTASFTNTSTATLNANAIGAKPIYAGGAALKGYEITSGGVYLLAYDTALNSAAGGWHMVTPPSMIADPALNPYGTAYPSWMYGIGGSSYYDIKPFARGGTFAPRGPVNFANTFPYGGLDQPMGGTFSVGAPARPGGVAGFTAPGQSAGYDEFGMSALLTQADSRPVMKRVAGTFTATTFVPTTPFALSTTAGSEVILAVGMWVRTNDSSAYNGQITSWAVNGSNEVTSITVSNWYQRGGGGSSGTPAGTYVIINPLDKIWTQLSTTFLNSFTFTGTCTSGSSTVTSVSSSAGIVPNGTLCYGIDGASSVVVPHGTVITGMNAAGTTIFLSANATTNGTVTFTATYGTDMSKAVAAEIDMHNSGPNFTPVWIEDTGDITNGSYTVSNLTLTSQWRAGLMIYGTGIGATPNYVVSVDYGTNSLRLKYPATATTVGLALKAQNQFDECGTGWDMLAANSYSNIGYLARGSWTYSFYAMGGLEDGFICRPDFLAGLPKYGFRVDGRLNGFPTVYSMAVTSDTYAYWGVTGAGATFQRGNIVFAPAGSATPAENGHATFELTSNTELKIKVKGSDGTVRSVSLTLAP
jgi:hypothetical protein